MRDVLEEMDGPGVEPGVSSNGKGEFAGGGVTDTDRCIAGIWMVGRARQNEEVLAAGGCGCGIELVLASLPSVVALRAAPPINSFCRAFAATFARFLSLSRSFFSFFLNFLSSSSLSTSLYGPTPFNKLVKASLGGRISKVPAITAVAERRIRFAGCIARVCGVKRMAMGGEHDRKGFIWETAVEQSRGLEGLVGLLRHNCKHQQTTALRVVPTRAYQGTFRGFPNRSIHVSTIYLHSVPFSIIPAFSFALSLQISLKN